MVVVDVGAHIGYYTWLFAKLVGENGRVIAYEASPENFSLLKHNIQVKRLKNVYPINAAVCDRTASVNLYVSPGNSNHSLVKGYTKYEAVLGVKGVTLDDSFASISVTHIDFIKIDAEGAEPSILRGMSGVLEHSPNLAMIIEINPIALKADGIESRKLLSRIADCGFQAKVIRDDGQVIEPEQATPGEIHNLLCLKPDQWHHML